MRTALLIALFAAAARGESTDAAPADGLPLGLDLAAPAAQAASLDPVQEAIEAVVAAVPAPPVEIPAAIEPEPELRAAANPEADIFREVLALVEAHYFDPSTPREQLFLGAAEGLLKRLSPAGSPEANEIIDGDAYAAMKRALAGGEMVGIGVLIDNRRGRGARVAAVMPGGPASRGGIRAGDAILWVDGQPAVRIDGRPDIERLRGPAGSRVRLVLQRGVQPLEVSVAREPLRMAFHSAQLLPDGVGVVRVNLFNQETGAALRDQMEQLKAGGAKALILDLRACEGGALEGALDLARALLPAGKTIAILKRRGTGEEKHVSEGPDLFPGPVAVLVDGETKSAAELVAAALRDNGKAILVGQRTYGKATAESIFELSSGRALKLTTAAYHSPTGRSWQGEGIEPDVQVEPVPGSAADAPLEAARRILTFRR